jgi:PAS domain S-box-containing protein
MFERLRQHGWSIWTQLLLYGLALLLPALIFSGLMILRSASLERAAMQREVRDVVRSVAIAIDRELAASMTTLKALASSPSLQEGALEEFYGQAAAAHEVSGDHFFLTSRSGKQLLNTRAEWGSPLPKISGNDWEVVVDTGEPRISNLYQGIMARGPAFSVTVPVKRNGQTRYVLSASITPDRILAIFNREALDKAWVASVTDRNGIIIARSKDANRYVATALRDDLWEGSQGRSGPWQTIDADGTPVMRATTVSRQSGWLVSTTVPTAIANEPIYQSWALVAALAISCGLLSALLAFSFGRQISEPVRQLAEGARVMGRGGRVEPIDSSIQEIRAVGDTLVVASETRRSMEQSLRQSEDRLRRALASADTGTWDWNFQSGAMTWDRRMRELWGLGPDEEVTFDRFLSAVHEQDRKGTLAAIERAKDGDYPVEYDVEHRVKGIGDGVDRWVGAKGRAYFSKGVAVGMSGTARDVTERKNWEDHTTLLMREITHRSKNLLAVIQAMARQSKDGSNSVAEFVSRFSGRLQALAAAHDLLVQRDWHGVAVDDLVISQIGHFLHDQARQIEFTGPKIVVTPEAAQNIGLAIHELSTNAVKYGALSVSSGRVEVAWRCQDDDAGAPCFVMSWRERGGPPVTPPSRSGFGLTVTEQLAARALQGKAELAFEPEGVRWSIEIPIRHVLRQVRTEPEPERAVP